MAPRRSSRPPRGIPPRRGSSAYNYTIKPPIPQNGYSVTIISPVNGATLETKRPTIKISVSSILGDPVDVQVEWRTQVPFLLGGNPDIYNPASWRPYPPTQASEHLAVPSGSTLDIQPPNDLTNTSWYYRVRAGNKATNVWTQYTAAARFLNVIPVLGSTATYFDWNVGVIRPQTVNSAVYMDFNVGVAAFAPQGSVQYSDLNIGVLPGWKAAGEYLDINIFPPVVYQNGARYLDFNVTTTRPTPTIWWIRPEQGREGYVFHIYGHGFGSFQNQYDGRVFLGSLICQVTRWSLVPPTILPASYRAQGSRASANPGTQTVPFFVYNNQDTIVLNGGDVIEYDQKWETSGTALNVFPTMSLQNNNITPLTSGFELTDVNGVLWGGTPAGATSGGWVHRKYIVPTTGSGGASNWRGQPVNRFGLQWMGSGAGQQAGWVRNFTIKDSFGNVRLYATNDDRHLGSTDAIYTSVGGSVLTSSEKIQESDRIIHGQGLDPDEITVEHGWITVVVPNGAVSAMVKVVLEGN